MPILPIKKNGPWWKQKQLGGTPHRHLEFLKEFFVLYEAEAWTTFSTVNRPFYTTVILKFLEYTVMNGNFWWLPFRIPVLYRWTARLLPVCPSTWTRNSYPPVCTRRVLRDLHLPRGSDGVCINASNSANQGVSLLLCMYPQGEVGIKVL